jgi:N-acetylneuraminic acid mutarotase
LKRDYSITKYHKHLPMKSSITLTLFLTLLFSCTDDLSLAPDAQKSNLNTQAISGVGPVATNGYVWTLMPRYNDGDITTCPTNDTFSVLENTCRIIEINGDIYGFSGGAYDEHYSDVERKLNNTTKQWESFDPAVRSAMKTVLGKSKYLFSYGDKMYTGLSNLQGYEKIVYSLNHKTGTIHQVSQFPGTARYGVISFVVGNKGYVMGGWANISESPYYNMSLELWEYNFDTNVWTNKGIMPGGPRGSASAFVMGSDVYFGLGCTALSAGYPVGPSRDWIKFDPSNPTAFTILQSFPGAKRRHAPGFMLNNKIYLGWGRTMENESNTDDFWEYNPSTNMWKEKTKCPTDAESLRPNHATFVQGNAGYVVIGCLTKLWRYSNTAAVPVPPIGTGPVVVPTNP